MNTVTAGTTLQEIRTRFHEGIKAEKSCRALASELEQKPGRTALEEGYLGATLMVQAQYEFWPMQKLAAFTKGKALLEAAIQQQPKETELRYLRYIIQVESPSFLNYRTALKEDREHLFNALQGKTDAVLQQYIRSFLEKDKTLSAAERSRLGK